MCTHQELKKRRTSDLSIIKRVDAKANETAMMMTIVDTDSDDIGMKRSIFRTDVAMLCVCAYGVA